MTGRLLAKPSLLRDMCDAVETVNRSPGQLSDDTWTYMGGRLSCTCGHRQSSRHLRSAAWGPVLVSSEATTEQHFAGCPAAQIMATATNKRKVVLNYTGLRYILQSAIQLSLNISWGAGSCSVSPSFAYHPTIDSETAPAFKIVRILSHPLLQIPSLSGYDRIHAFWLKRMVPLATQTILKLFRTNLASPRAVDTRNESLVFGIINLVSITRHPDD